MAEIPRVPQVSPAISATSPVHRVGASGDKPHGSKQERETPQEDILELHGEEADEEQEADSARSDDDAMPPGGHLDLAV
jgi:hypothetical protein